MAQGKVGPLEGLCRHGGEVWPVSLVVKET